MSSPILVHTKNKNNKARTERPVIHALRLRERIMKLPKAGSNSTLMVRPEKSTIELTADLRNINVKMKPMPINAPSTFELGDTITLWCNYSINKDTGIKWTYDKNLFAEVSQSASVTQSKFQINLKSKQAFSE